MLAGPLKRARANEVALLAGGPRAPAGLIRFKVVENRSQGRTDIQAGVERGNALLDFVFEHEERVARNRNGAKDVLRK